MRNRFARVPHVLVAALLALAAVSGCKDARYCAEDKPCTDPAYPYCDLVLHECEATGPPDGGVDAAGDAPRPDGPGDGPAPDGQSDAPPADDGGCQAPQRECAGYCYDLDDPTHCGASCEQCTVPTNGQATCNGTSCGFTCDATYFAHEGLCDPCDVASHCGPTCAVCGGNTPDCSGHAGKCVCNGTSCTGTTPICDTTTQACRPCQAHSDCASGACDPSGACVAVSDIIYLDKNNAGCIDTGNGAGEQATPFCTFPPALTKALAGPKYRIVIRPGTYSYSADTVVTNKTVVIIGAGAVTTELVQDKNNTPVLELTGTANVTLVGLTLRTTASTGSHGIKCTGPAAGDAFLTVRQCTLRDNPLRGLEANLCTVIVVQSVVQGNDGGGVSLTDSDFVVENCLLVKNGSTGSSCTTSNKVGGVRMSGNGTATADRFVNNTVADNVACNTVSPGVQCDSGTTVDVRNSIVWANVTGTTDPQIGGVGCTTTNSWVQGVGGATDPYFKGGSPFDYHLQTNPPDPNNSPCINAGTATAAPLVDLEGKARTNTPDIGCYEAQ